MGDVASLSVHPGRERLSVEVEVEVDETYVGDEEVGTYGRAWTPSSAMWSSPARG